jgi:hypothetical protein
MVNGPTAAGSRSVRSARVNHPDVWLLLVGERGWTPEEFESWFAATACDQLVEPAGRRRARR